QAVCRVTQPGSPVAARSPGRSLQQQASPGIGGDRGVLVEVRAEHPPPCLVLDQREGGELAQRDAPVEDQVGLDPAVGDEWLAMQAGELCRLRSLPVHARPPPDPDTPSPAGRAGALPDGPAAFGALSPNPNKPPPFRMPSAVGSTLGGAWSATSWCQPCGANIGR